MSERKVEVHIGVDDTDSPRGMCTTFLGAVLARKLAERGVEFLDFPYLIRLNPNIPFKTRGNGAVSLHLKIPESKVGEVIQLVGEYVELLSEQHGKTDPTAVIVIGGVGDLRSLYEHAVWEVVSPTLTLEKLRNKNSIILGSKKGRGVVGAVASIGAFPLSQFTFELLLYRPLSTRCETRTIEEDLVYTLDRLLRPYVFANVDYTAKRALAIPHGPDPVIAGFRSTNPLLLSSLIRRLHETVNAEISMIYKTNQATGAHLREKKAISKIRPYDSVVVEGVVVEKPRIIKGGHVVFHLKDSQGRLYCAVYRETGRLTRVARLLRKDFIVEVGGGVHPRQEGLTLNVEYIRVIHSPPLKRLSNPLCPNCGRRMKSAGRGKGFKCHYCGYRNPNARKIVTVIPPILEPGLYLQSPRAYRHLSVPAEILGQAPIDLPPLPTFFVWPPPPKAQVFKPTLELQQKTGDDSDENTRRREKSW